MISFSLLGKFGRLGNQLFQIASTIGIARANGQPYMFPTWQYNEYLLSGLPTNDNRMLQYLIHNESWPFLGIPDLRGNNWDLQGYYQTWKYFDHCKNDILNQFRFRDENVSTEGIDRVAIHVRRGDFLGLNNIHPNLPMDYYERAMNLFPDKEFSIFSDDIDWCRDNFNLDRCVFISSGEPLMDLLFMSKHSAVVTANSSFSWWAGYLSSGPVVVPKVWALNEPITCMQDRIPTDWTIVNYAD